MGKLDQLADNWFQVFDDCVAKELGRRINYRRSLKGSRVSTILGYTEGGGDMRCFNLDQRTWDVIENDDIQVDVECDGTVSVGYTLEDQASLGMTFRVEHPREVSELFSLLIRRAKHAPPMDDCPFAERKLGDVADIQLLLPDGDTWRVLDPSAIPEEVPVEFCKALYSNLMLDVDTIFSESFCAAWRFTQRWPGIVKSLPDAARQVCAGYILDPPAGTMKSAVDLAVMPPDKEETMVQVLIVPDAEAVSALYLREALSGDQNLAQRLVKACLVKEGLDAWIQAVKGVAIHLPVELGQQVRIAAEANAVREWVRFMADKVAVRCGFPFQTEKNWHLAHTLSRMLD